MMSIENQELLKSLTEIIEEVANDVASLEKSDRYEECKMGDDDSGMGQSKNGALNKEEDKEEDKEEKKKKKEDSEEEEDKAEKGEGTNLDAVENPGGFDNYEKDMSMGKGEVSMEPKKSNLPGFAEKLKDNYKQKQAEQAKKSEDKEMEKAFTDLVEPLAKSMVEEAITPILEKVNALANVVQQMAKTPIESRALTVKSQQKLNKSFTQEAPEALSKSEVLDKLESLQKSGDKRVDSNMVMGVALGTRDHTQIAQQLKLEKE
jgi:hypothetical protein